MAAIEDLIKQIAEPGLRDQLAAEVAQLKSTKKFGLPREVLFAWFPDHRLLATP
jgi:hypothetical protein